jgi:hypothetical protein
MQVAQNKVGIVIKPKVERKQEMSCPTEPLSFFIEEPASWNSIAKLIFENWDLHYIGGRINPTNAKC